VDTTAANQRNYARSMHAGGVNVLFCDGSVRDVVDTINATVWRNLGDKSDGEAVGDF
jgi:prepilin-type processing-associated H-X9-DG protein